MAGVCDRLFSGFRPFPGFPLHTRNLPGRAGYRDPGMAIDADADILVIALVDRLHLALADGAQGDAGRFLLSAVWFWNLSQGGTPRVTPLLVARYIKLNRKWLPAPLKPISRAIKQKTCPSQRPMGWACDRYNWEFFMARRDETCIAGRPHSRQPARADARPGHCSIPNTGKQQRPNTVQSVTSHYIDTRISTTHAVFCRFDSVPRHPANHLHRRLAAVR